MKTRTLAADIVTAGKVRVNRVRVDKPAQTVRAGDVLDPHLNRRIQLVRVLGIAERRGPSAAARALYEELTAEGDVIKPQSPSSAPVAQWQPQRGEPGQAAGGERAADQERASRDRSAEWQGPLIASGSARQPRPATALWKQQPLLGGTGKQAGPK